MKISLIAAALAVSVSAATAADFPVKAQPSYAAQAAYSWTGFYIGAQGSYNWQNFNFPDPAVTGLKPKGAMGGVTIGADYQMGSVVAGVLGDVDFGNIGLTVPNGTVMTESVNEKIFGTIRGRIGYLVLPTLLIYGTAGVAIASVEQGENCPTGAMFGFCAPKKAGPYNLIGNQTYVGGVFGAGTEWAFAPHWSTKLEYLYSNLGSMNFNLGSAPSGTATTPRDISLTQQQLRLGVNYRF